MNNCIRMRPMCEPRNKDELLNCIGYEPLANKSCKYISLGIDKKFLLGECMNLNMKILEARYERGII